MHLEKQKTSTKSYKTPSHLIGYLYNVSYLKDLGALED